MSLMLTWAMIFRICYQKLKQQKENPLHSKGSNQQTNSQPTEWEEIFASRMSDKGLLILLYMFKLYKGSKKTQ